jgi:hypothetical protein
MQTGPKMNQAPHRSTDCRPVSQNGANFTQIMLNLGRGREKLAQI